MSEVNFSLAGKVALITGGSKGIGRSIALAFAEHGAVVAIVARGAEALAATSRDIEATGRRCLALGADMTLEADWARIVDETVSTLGGVDILVYGAATAKLGPIISSTSKGWDRVMQVNLKGAFMVSKLCHPHMKQRGGGAVIHITSNECIRPSAGLGTYSISKGAMVTMMQGCAKEWASDQIRVNCIASGLVRTELAEPLVKMVEQSGSYPDPLKRIGEPHEIAGIALYLASPAGAYATGQTFVVDGGELVYAPLDNQ
jgi:NAD(P)-dependent dehydrogenase (short-subunit alcohol dehydrogenase family)